MMADMETADEAIRDVIRSRVLKPSIIERALDLAVTQLATTDHDRRPPLREQLAAAERRLENLTDVAAKGGAVPAVLSALSEAERERQRVAAQLAALGREGPAIDSESIKPALRAFLDDWTRLLGENVAEARSVLESALETRIAFRPMPSEKRYELIVPIAYDRILTAAIPTIGRLQDVAEKMASPPGFEPGFWP